MDQARLVDLVLQSDAKWLADIGREAVRAVRLPDPEDGSRLSVDYDGAGLKLKYRPRRRVSTRPGGWRGLPMRDGPKAG
jgi:hypothetical protein